MVIIYYDFIIRGLKLLTTDLQSCDESDESARQGVTLSIVYIRYTSICSRSFALFYIVTYYIKLYSRGFSNTFINIKFQSFQIFSSFFRFLIIIKNLIFQGILFLEHKLATGCSRGPDPDPDNPIRASCAFMHHHHHHNNNNNNNNNYNNYNNYNNNNNYQ